MIYLLDTNICIYIMKNKPEKVKTKLQSKPMGLIGISSITLAELWYGVDKSKQAAHNSKALKEFSRYMTLHDWSRDSARFYGKIRSTLEKSGKIIGANDLLIAAHALALSATLVTNNVKEFERVDGLLIENWA